MVFDLWIDSQPIASPLFDCVTWHGAEWAMTATERKRRQREKDAEAGIVEATVRVPKRNVPLIRRLAAQMLAQFTKEKK